LRRRRNHGKTGCRGWGKGTPRKKEQMKNNAKQLTFANKERTTTKRVARFADGLEKTGRRKEISASRPQREKRGKQRL